MVVAWWWLLVGVWWVKWDVSGGFLMGFARASCLEEEEERETAKKEWGIALYSPVVWPVLTVPTHGLKVVT